MRVLVLNWRDIKHPQAGGAEHFVQNISTIWARSGHEVIMLVGGFDSGPGEELMEGVRVLRVGGRFSVYPMAALAYMKLSRKAKFDVVIDDINGVPFFTPLYIRGPKVAVIHHLVKGIFSRELRFPFSFVGRSAERLIPFLYHDTRIVTVSESTKAELVDFGVEAEMIDVVLSGVSEDLMPRPEARARVPTVVYVGRLKSYKRLDLLIRAMAEVRDTMPDARLVLAGAGDDEQRLKALTSELGLEGAVQFSGFISEQEKLATLQSAWVGAITSEKEGWGLTVIEPNRCAVPVVAFDVAGVRDSVKDGTTGILVADGDVGAFAEALLRLLGDADLRERMAQAALEWSSNFSWAGTAESFMRTIERVRKESRGEGRGPGMEAIRGGGGMA